MTKRDKFGKELGMATPRKAIGYAASANVEDAMDCLGKIERAANVVNEITGLPAEVYRQLAIIYKSDYTGVRALSELLTGKVKDV